MTKYADVRARVQQLLGVVRDIADDFPDVVAENGKIIETPEVRQYVDQFADPLLDRVSELMDNHDNHQVCMSDPAQATVLGRGIGLLRCLKLSGLLNESQYGRVGAVGLEAGEVRTPLPPIAPEGVTGEFVLDYLHELRNWIIQSSCELFGDDSEPELPALGQRYMIGDFAQVVHIVQQLQRSQRIRELWLQLSSTGDHWDGVDVGCSRARLIAEAKTVYSAIYNPDPEPTPAPGLLG